MGIYASLQFFGAFLGGLIGGTVSGNLGATTLFALTAAVGLIWFFIASGMQIPARMQRLSYAVSVENDSAAASLLAQLSAVPGVLEATLVRNEQRCYLKVSSTGFDAAAIEALLQHPAAK